MKKFLSAALTAFAVVLLTSGCVKLGINVTVTPQDTVDGNLVIGLSNKAIQAMNDYGSVSGNPLESNDYLKGSKFNYKVSDFNDGEFTGKKYSFQDVPVKNFSTGNDTLVIKRVGDNITIDGVLDMTDGQDPAALKEQMSNPLTAAFFSGADISITAKLPGEIKSTNGVQTGNTIKWTGAFGEKVDFHAVAYAPRGLPAWALAAISISALAIIVVVLALTMRKKKNSSKKLESSTD